MEELFLGTVKKGFRLRKGELQVLKLFTREQKEKIMDQVENRSKGTRITDVLEMYGISPVVYHSWVKKFRPLLKDVLKNEMVSHKTIKKIELHIEIDSPHEICTLVSILGRIKGVKGVIAS